MVLWIVATALVVSFLAGILLVLIGLCVKTFRRQADEESESPPGTKKFKGIASHPSFKAAVHQSLAATQQNATAILHTADTYYYDTSMYSTYMDCHTCALIMEGSSMAYSDNTCPQCGRDTAHLTDLSINHFA